MSHVYEATKTNTKEHLIRMFNMYTSEMLEIQMNSVYSYTIRKQKLNPIHTHRHTTYLMVQLLT
jgi:hypothetical protein